MFFATKTRGRWHGAAVWAIGGLLVLVGASALSAADSVVAGELRVDPTFDHLGIRWEISGDDDLDSTLTVEFRRPNGPWLPAAQPMRAHPTIVVDGAPLNENYWAASALFLDPGVAYDLRIQLDDPDGGGELRLLTRSVRSQPSLSDETSVRYVVPGSGGGSGTPSDPYRGAQAAADAAQPGDLFLLQPGMYAPFELLTSGEPGGPITFRGQGAATVIDGGATDRGIITLGVFDTAISHITIENLTIENGTWGIDAQNTQELVVRNNVIQDVDFGINNRRENALELNQTVCDNTIKGRTFWPQGGIPGERGVNLSGTGNVVCFNEISNFGDCITIANENTQADTFGNDAFGNDVSLCVDDGIEIDYNESNTRVWRNRVYNARAGVSTQPIRGGPAYIFRNEMFNLENSAIKLNNSPSGLVVAHNTGIKRVNGVGDSNAPWSNAIFRNNLFLGTRYAFEFLSADPDGTRDFDYNAWGTTREIGGPGEPYFKWDNIRYDRLVDLPAGVEDHGVETAFEDLIDATLSAQYEDPVDPGSRDLRLILDTPPVGAGIELDNLNDPFGIIARPDAGAFEVGRAVPEYGPRAFADLTLTVSGSCPGFTTVEITGGTPNGSAVLLRGTGIGDDELNVRCIGLETGLANPALVFPVSLDETGAFSTTPQLPAGACGTPIQVVDPASCRISEVVSVP